MRSGEARTPWTELAARNGQRLKSRLNTGLSPPCPRQESNLDLPLRRRSSYPLDYEGAGHRADGYARRLPTLPTALHRRAPPTPYRCSAPVPAVDSPANRASSSPTSRWVIHSPIVCAPMRR
jgi:hypothetical protein